MARMVDRLEGHTPGQRAIADHRNAAEILASVIPGHRHPQGSGDGRAGMTSTEMVKFAF
ncbi:MAG: Uncharacterised protein [Synechococcus sp. CC9902]|nr:MAG: Uncharacterised protein [Synechococcus sp. CC9902]